VSERDRAGMMRQVTTVLNLPRGPASVPRRQQGVRASWDQLQASVGPLLLGEAVECVLGVGSIEELNPDKITIKLDYGKSVTFSSLGTPLNLA